MKYFIDNWDKISTIFFAFLSATFAGLSAYILCLEYKRNNPKIVVKMNRAILSQGSFVTDIINCSILNKGRRPTTITGYYFLLKDSQKFFYPLGEPMAIFGTDPRFPQTLNESEKYDFNITHSSLKTAIQNLPAPITHLCFHDTSDNIYKYKLKKKYWKELINFK